MEHQETPTPPLTEELALQLKTQRKKYLIWILVLIVVNTILYGILMPRPGPESMKLNFLTALNANLLGINILGFLLGTVVAIFPYKGLPYQKKYLRASLLTILVIQIVMASGLISVGLMAMMGWRG